MKRVLFISFYWPPSGKASLQWPLDMVRHLSEIGWQISVLTVIKDTFSVEDDSFSSSIPKSVKVYRTDFWDPFVLYRNLLGKRGFENLDVTEAVSSSNPDLKQRLSLWIRMNLFIPDARIGWMIPGMRASRKFFKSNDFDLIVSNGPPHSTHLLGKRISRILKVPLVTVFIDPWVDISYYKNYKRNRLVLGIDEYLERSVLKHAVKSVFVTKGLIDYFEQKYGFLKNKTELLHWGYAEDNFIGVGDRIKPEEKLILHAGNIYDHQDIPLFWKFIREENLKGNNLRLRFVGNVSPRIKRSIKEAGIDEYTEFMGFLGYSEVLNQMFKASYLLVCCSEPRHIPGKLFEYLRTGRPIIAFGDDNKEVEQILGESNSGVLLSYKEKGDRFFKTLPDLSPDIEKVKKYDRRKIAERFAEILDKI